MKTSSVLNQSAYILEELKQDNAFNLAQSLREIAYQHRPRPNPLAALTILKDNPTQSYDAMELRHAYQDAYGYDYDWHEYSVILDHARTNGFIAYANDQRWKDGMTRYIWKPTTLEERN